MSQDHFTYQRHRFDIIDRIVLGRKTYLVTRKLSGDLRRRLQAFDPHAGPRGQMRVVHLLPRAEETWQRVNVLQRLGQSNPELPQILEFHRRLEDIAIVQPWIEGHDLRWWIQNMRRSDQQRMGTPEAIRLCRGLAHALHHLHHRCHVVHADIKPANIILSTQSRRLVLIDFGSAWNAERTAIRSQGDGRSPLYAAPEILTGCTNVDFRADYFSMASVCYEILTQQVPYDGLGGGAGAPTYRSESDSLYVPPSKLSREATLLDARVWQAMDGLLGKALRIDRDARFANGHEWLEAWQSVHNLLQQPAPRSLLDKILFRLADWFDQRSQNTR